MITLYGISNCDTVRKARKWLDQNDVSYQYHDFRKDGLDASTVRGWLQRLGAEVLVNRKSASWRNLDTKLREQIENGDPVPVLVNNPTLIKRPVLAADTDLNVGFNELRYSQLTTTQE